MNPLFLHKQGYLWWLDKGEDGFTKDLIQWPQEMTGILILLPSLPQHRGHSLCKIAALISPDRSWWDALHHLSRGRSLHHPRVTQLSGKAIHGSLHVSCHGVDWSVQRHLLQKWLGCREICAGFPLIWNSNSSITLLPNFNHFKCKQFGPFGWLVSSAHTINTYLGYWLKPFYHSSKEDMSMEKAKQEIIWADRTSICLQHTEKCIPLVRNFFFWSPLVRNLACL